jgi:hypothetical protein
MQALPINELNAQMYQTVLAAAKAHFKFQERERIYMVPLPASYLTAVHMIDRNCEQQTVELVEYADYINIEKDADLMRKAEIAGVALASGYALLVGAALRKHGFDLTVVDLFENNLFINIVTNSSPSYADVEGKWRGWIAWRYKFAVGAHA